MSEELAKTNAPPDLVQGLHIGWVFGGPVMLVFGILCISTFWKRFRRQPVSTFAPALISIAYLAFGSVGDGDDRRRSVFHDLHRARRATRDRVNSVRTPCRASICISHCS